MTKACPYCEQEVKARGRKNHVRLSSGDGHGENGELPDSYEADISALETDSEPAPEPDSDNDGDDTPDSDDTRPSDTEQSPQEVTVNQLGNVDTEPADTGADGNTDGLPFDPEADGAIELDGGEQLVVRHNGEPVETTADSGDYLLITEQGPVLYDPSQDTRFEVLTQ